MGGGYEAAMGGGGYEWDNWGGDTGRIMGYAEGRSPAKAETSPAKAETSPAKAETSPAKAETSPAKAETSPAKAETSPAKAETSAVQRTTSAKHRSFTYLRTIESRKCVKSRVAIEGHQTTKRVPILSGNAGKYWNNQVPKPLF